MVVRTPCIMTGTGTLAARAPSQLVARNSSHMVRLRRLGGKSTPLVRVRSKVGEEETVADSELEEMSSKLNSYMAGKITSVDANKRRSDFTMDGNAKLVYGSAIAVGGLSGLAIVLFEEATKLVREFGLEVWLPFLGASKSDMYEVFAQVDQLPHFGAAWPVATLPLFGGLAISGMRLALGSRDLEPALKTLNMDPGKNSKDIKIWKFSSKAAAAAVTLGTANSLGPEGPVVELGGNIGLAIGRKLGFRGEDLRGYLASGAASGLAAGFNAPVSAVFFALEVVLQKTTNKQLLTTALLASVISAAVKDQVEGLQPKFVIEQTLNNGLVEVPMFMLVGAGCGIMAVVLEKSMGYSATFYSKLPVSKVWHPLVGSMVMSLTALVVPETLFLGYQGVDFMLKSDASLYSLMAAGTLLVIAGTKVFVTSMAAGSGLVGGVFAPSLFIGAAVGSSIGTAAQTLGLGPDGLHYVSGPAVYALVGMPSMLGAFVKAPLTSILLLFEITRDYNVLIPVMAGVSASMFTQAELAKLLAPAVPAGTPKWLSLNDGAMLESTLTSKAMVTDFVAISVDTPLLGAARAIADAQAAQALSTCYGIVLEGKDGEVLGSVTLRQVMDEVADVIKPLQIAFSQFDVDGSGEIDLEEMSDLLKKIGSTASDEKMRSLFDMLDVDGSGAIDFQEFVVGGPKLGIRTGERTLAEAFGDLQMGSVSDLDNLLVASQTLQMADTGSIVVMDTDGKVVGLVVEEVLQNTIDLIKLERSLDSLAV